MKIVLYTTPTCSKCKVLKQKMNAKNIEFIEINDIEICQKEGIDLVPVLEIDGKKFEFSEANKIINEWEVQ